MTTRWLDLSVVFSLPRVKMNSIFFLLLLFKKNHSIIELHKRVCTHTYTLSQAKNKKRSDQISFFCAVQISLFFPVDCMRLSIFFHPSFSLQSLKREAEVIVTKRSADRVFLVYWFFFFEIVFVMSLVLRHEIRQSLAEQREPH